MKGVIFVLQDILYNGVNIPPVTENYIHRKEIYDLFQTSLTKPLITVVAIAGFGKTQFVSNFLNRNSDTIYFPWFSLNDLDNVISRYAERFLYASGFRNKELSENLSTLEIPYTEKTYKRYFDILKKHTPPDKKIVLVLEDFHFINNPEILIFIENHTLLNIPDFSVVIISRTTPAFNTELLLSKGLIASITEKDLQFTKAEMSIYFKQIDIDFDSETETYLYDYTGGWLIALHHLSILGKSFYLNKEELISSLKLNTFDFIKNEIFFAYSEKFQLFLVKLSFFDNLTLDLIKEIAFYDLELVNDFLKINFLVSLDKFSKKYNFNKLFRDFLSEMQIKLTQKETFELHLLTANWYKNNGFEMDAINSYEKCGLFNNIFDVIIGYKKAITVEIFNLFLGVIERAPKKIIKARPIIRVVYSRYLLDKLEPNKSLLELNKMRKEFELLPQSKENNAMLGEIYIMLAWVSMLTRTYDFVNLFKLAYYCLPNGSSLVDNEIQLVSGNNACIVSDSKLNELQIFKDAYFEAMPYATKVMNGCGYGLDFLVAAESDYLIKEMISAEKNAYEAIRLSNIENQYGIENMANFILVRLNVAKGNYLKVCILLDEFKNKIKTRQYSNDLIEYDIIEGWFYNTIGETGKVASWITLEQESKKIILPLVISEEHMIRARCYLSGGKYYELLAFLDQLKIVYNSKDMLMANINIPILKAMALYNVGEKENAFLALEEAYNLSISNNIIMPFIEHGNKMRTLIYSTRNSEHCHIPKSWLDSIYTKSSSHAKQISRVVSSYKKLNNIEEQKTRDLTKRELEILTHLSHGLTREQIAVSCDLSVNTVKSVLQNIYSKLGASNKRDAVHFATIMNIL